MTLIERPLRREGKGSFTVYRSCPVCGSHISRTLQDQKNARVYLLCDNCRYIFLQPENHLSTEEQKRRYLRHRNSLEEEGYINFLSSFLQRVVIPHIERGAHVLDYGSGPVPAFSWLLDTNGYRVDSFDPFFFPDTSWEKETYRAAIMIEVLEHLSNPVGTLKNLRDRIAPGGYICIRSSLHDENPSHFATWWYRQDPTHVSFFSITTIEYLSTALGLRTISIADDRDIVLQRPLAFSPLAAGSA